MLILLLILYLTGTHARAASLPVPLLPEAESSWKFVERSGDIEIYERWVHLKDGLEVRERKGVMKVRSTVEETVTLICDPYRANLWVNGVSQCYFVRKDSDVEWFTYTRYSLPWPIDDRDLVTHHFMTSSGTGHEVKIILESEEGLVPENQGTQRLRRYHASWEVADVGGGTVRVTFIARSDDPPPFPRWLQDPIVADAFLENLQQLKEELEIGNVKKPSLSPSTQMEPVE